MMKKLISFVVLLTILAVGITAVAEEAALKEEEVKFGNIESLPYEKLPENNQKSYALDGYTVTNVDEKYTVSTGDLTISIDLSAYPSLMTMTRDFFASIKAYIYFDYDAVLAMMESNNCHFLLLDMETMNEIHIYSKEGDATTARINNFSDLSSANQMLVATVNTGSSEVLSIGNCSWMKMYDNLFVTIVNGQYVVLRYGTENGATAEDLADTCEILSSLVIN